MASSRVGEMMTARAEEVDLCWFFCLSLTFAVEDWSERMHGTPKAKVLPDPVSATPMTSRPEKRNGQEADWIGVGDLKAANGEGEAEKFGVRWEKEMMGRSGVVDVESVMVMKFSLR